MSTTTIRPTPTSALFPYTTLFRSDFARFAIPPKDQQPRVVLRFAAEKDLLLRDRKSTRLNSSHGYISYAVFCLKKKNLSVPRLCHSLKSRIYRPTHRSRSALLQTD